MEYNRMQSYMRTDCQMLYICNRIFTAANKFQKIIIKVNIFLHTFAGKRIYQISSILLPILGFIFCFFAKTIVDSKWEIYIAAFLFLVIFIVLFAYDFYKLFISLRWFLFSQLVISSLIFLAIKSILSSKMIIINDNALFIGTFFIICCFFSITANSTVSVTGNTIITALASIMLLVGNTIITMMPAEDNFPTYSGNFFGIPIIYTFQQKNQVDFNLATMPILIINGIAAILAALKSYWVKKYNGGQEISWEDFEDIN